MVGITSHGVYIPKYRLKRRTIASVWGQQFIAGERSVCNHDEDSLTMAAEAVLNCIEGSDPKAIDGLIFSTTTSPYLEKQASSFIATVADAREDIFTADCLSSLRSSTAALISAIDAIRAGSGRQYVVVAADCRPAEPGSDLEQISGDGSAALLVGTEGAAAAVEGVYSISEEFLDVWRKADEHFLQKGDAAFITTHGYHRIVKHCIEGILKKYRIRISDISRYILPAPDSRSYIRMASSLKLPPGSYPEDPLLTTVGYTGTASSLLQFVDALGQAKPGELLLLCSYGAGNADAVIFKVTDDIQRMRDRKGVRRYLSSGRELAAYEKFLRLRRIVPDRSLKPYSSWALLWKERKQNLQLYGTRCKRCGAFAFPRRRVCLKCSAKDAYEDARLPKKGKIYTFTKDYLYPSVDPPTVMAVADMDNYGRFYGQLTDCDPDSVRIGMEVELTVRKFHEGDEFHNYFWKLRPAE